MATPTGQELALEGLRLAATLIYAAVGAMVLRRQVADEADLAKKGFALWWLGLAAVGALALPFGLGLNIADYGLGVWRAFVYLFIVLIYVALGGLLYYLLYLYTGRHDLYKPIAWFYVGMTAFLVWFIEAGAPFVATDEAGDRVVEMANEPSIWVSAFFSFALLIPILVAAFAYAALFFRVEDRRSKYRVALVSTGIILWFLYSTGSSAFQLASGAEEQSLAGQVIGQILGLVAAVLVLLAYAPPARVQRWIDAGGVPAA